MKGDFNMASTNKTTNYNLSQYVGSDKPTYLGDYNSDMQKIDTQMKANADSASSANSLATTAKSTADLAEEHAQTAITNASTADEKAVSAQNSASQANLTAQQALAIAQSFNLNTYEQIDNTDILCPDGTVDTSTSSITVAKNSDGSLAKIYGLITVNLSNHTGPVRISFPSSLRPTSEFTIQNAYIRRFVKNTGEQSIALNSITLKTNGTIELYASSSTSDNTSENCYLLPCLYWIKDFGDTPVNTN